MNTEGLVTDLHALRARTIAALSYSDFEHLRLMERVGRALTITGFACAWIGVNPVSIICIALGITARWMVMHHVGHGGYEMVPGTPDRYTRKRFAMGHRRWIDWFDWMEPTAWNYSHNQLHHYHTGEPADPDLVEHNLSRVRNLRAPRVIKYLIVFIGAITWKFAYYAPNVLNGLEAKRLHRRGAPHELFINIFNFWDLRLPIVRTLWMHSLIPYTLFNFVVIPALFLPLGRAAAVAVLLNLVFAELLANLHTFMVIVPSHAADDLVSFEGPMRSKSEFYLRQILTTANYHTGGDTNDFLHMWINYQIEHHLFPDLPMSTYRKIQPEVAAICAKHGVPYVQQSVLKRLVKLLDVCIGRTTPPRWTAPAPAPLPNTFVHAVDA